ncbi:hypothetical protein NA57DRAFT_73379 [Rhizodiscina lignyota]|uniref:Uncharacterized protein n=1 Tax=Rhizodiscina lignyota TaxID=1504668 RepID=A0A9P4IMG8_9PEZI|nr:hypothetical protein NA57DRAFT_73379 [Rhizodiscina lignyota]
MAPKRGSSGISLGGDGSGGGTVSNRCEGAFYFDSDNLGWSVAELVISGVSLVAFIVLFILYIVQVNRKPHATKIVKWWTFGLALIFTIIAFVLRLINDVLNDCLITSFYTYNAIWIAVTILFYGLAYLIWLAIFMLPLCLQMLRQARCPTKLAKITLSITLGVLSTIWVAVNVISSWNSWDQSRYFYYDVEFNTHIYNAANALSATYNVLYFVATLVGSAVLIYALVKIRQNPGIKIWVPFTIAFFLASNILSLIEVFHWTVPKKSYTAAASTATGVLDIVFIFGVALGILFSASSNGFAHSNALQSTPGHNPPPVYSDSVPMYKPEMDGQSSVVTSTAYSQYPQAPNNHQQQYPTHQQQTWNYQSTQPPGEWQQAQAQWQQPTEMPVQPPELHGQQRFEAPAQNSSTR